MAKKPHLRTDGLTAGLRPKKPHVYPVDYVSPEDRAVFDRYSEPRNRYRQTKRWGIKPEKSLSLWRSYRGLRLFLAASFPLVWWLDGSHFPFPKFIERYAIFCLFIIVFSVFVNWALADWRRLLLVPIACYVWMRYDPYDFAFILGISLFVFVMAILAFPFYMIVRKKD